MLKQSFCRKPKTFPKHYHIFSQNTASLAQEKDATVKETWRGKEEEGRRGTDTGTPRQAHRTHAQGEESEGEGEGKRGRENGLSSDQFCKRFHK